MLVALVLAASPGLPSQARMEAAMLEAVAGSCPRRKVALDPDLTRAAKAFAAATRDDIAPVEGSALAFYASLESSEPASIAGVATVAPPSNADRAVGDIFPKSCKFDRIGVAAATLGNGEAVVGALVATHATELARIPGRVEAGAIVDVQGKLAPGLGNARLFVTRPGGAVEELKLAADRDRFSARVILRAAGEHSIEILAEGAGGPIVVAVRRVFAGIDPPRAPPPLAVQGPGLDGVEAAIRSLRASHGLPPLERDPALDAVAEGHSREMARTQTFAHVLPGDGTLGDRLGKRGYAYRSAGENIGLSADAASAHDAIVGSPAHLANLLDPRHRRLGLGETRGSSPDGNEALYLTEVFAAPVVSSNDPAADVEQVLQGERKRRGLRALARDRSLDELAANQVRAAALTDAVQLPADLARKALDQVPELESAVAELYVTSGADDAARSKKAAEPRWTRLGVGAIYANSKAYGPGRLWIVLLYGR